MRGRQTRGGASTLRYLLWAALLDAAARANTPSPSGQSQGPPVLPHPSGAPAPSLGHSTLTFTGAIGTSSYTVDGKACGIVTVEKTFSGHPLKIVAGNLTWAQANVAPAVVSISGAGSETFEMTEPVYTYICESHSAMIGNLVPDCANSGSAPELPHPSGAPAPSSGQFDPSADPAPELSHPSGAPAPSSGQFDPSADPAPELPHPSSAPAPSSGQFDPSADPAPELPHPSGAPAPSLGHSTLTFTGAIGTSSYTVDGKACGIVTVEKTFSGHPLKIVAGNLTWAQANVAPAVVSISGSGSETFEMTEPVYTYICESHSAMIGNLVPDCANSGSAPELPHPSGAPAPSSGQFNPSADPAPELLHPSGAPAPSLAPSFDPSYNSPPWNTFGPPKSAHLFAAPPIISYATSNGGSLDLEDAHAVVGAPVSSGGYILAGKAMECADHCASGRRANTSEGFAVKMGVHGEQVWGWRSDLPGAHDAINGAVELPSGDILIAGWRTVGGVGKRALTKLNGQDGTEMWTFAGFGDAAGAHGAIELLTMIGTTDVLLSGLKEKPDAHGMQFKSYGNAAGGKAWLAKMTVLALSSRTTPPALSDITWQTTEADYMTCKAAIAHPDGSIAALLWGEDSIDKSAGLVVYNRTSPQSQGGGYSTVWGPMDYGEANNLEGTDIAVSADGTKIAMTGHGGHLATGKDYSGKLVIVDLHTGDVLSTTEITGGGTSEIIYNECFGVAAMSDGGFVVACGNGIEGCDHVSDANKSACAQGQGDLSAPGMKFEAGLWVSMAAKFNAAGQLVWKRSAALRAHGSAACDLCTNFTARSSSASEWVIANKDGSLAYVQDESDGFGVMLLGTGSGGTGEGGPLSPAPSGSHLSAPSGSISAPSTLNTGHHPTPSSSVPHLPGMEEIAKVRQELFELQNINAYISDPARYQIRPKHVGRNGLPRGDMVILEGFSELYNVTLTAPPSGLDYIVLTEIANRTQFLLRGLGLNATTDAPSPYGTGSHNYPADNTSSHCPFDPWAPGTPCDHTSPCVIRSGLGQANNISGFERPPSQQYDPNATPAPSSGQYDSNAGSAPVLPHPSGAPAPSSGQFDSNAGSAPALPHPSGAPAPSSGQFDPNAGSAPVLPYPGEFSSGYFEFSDHMLTISPKCMAVALSYCMVTPCDPGCSRVMAPPGMEFVGQFGGGGSISSSSGSGNNHSDNSAAPHGGEGSLNMGKNMKEMSGLNCSHYQPHIPHQPASPGSGGPLLGGFNPTMLAVEVHVNYTGQAKRGHHGTLKVFPPRLYFTDTNFNVPQTVTITAVNDDAYVPSVQTWSAIIDHRVVSPPEHEKNLSYPRHNFFYEREDPLNVTVIDDDVPLNSMQLILSRSRIRINEGLEKPEDILLYLSSPPADDAIVFVDLLIHSSRVVVSPPGPYVFSAANASTPVTIHFSAVDDVNDHIDVEKLVGFFAAFSETDPRLYLGNRSMFEGSQDQDKENFSGHVNASHSGWNMSLPGSRNGSSEQSRPWNETNGPEGTDDFTFFQSRLIVNFTLFVVDNDHSGLIVPRDTPAPPTGGHEFNVKEGEDFTIPLQLTSKPARPVVVQVLSHNPLVQLSMNRSSVDKYEIFLPFAARGTSVSSPSFGGESVSHVVQGLQILPKQWNVTHRVHFKALDDLVRRTAVASEGMISLVMRSEDPRYDEAEAAGILFPTPEMVFRDSSSSLGNHSNVTNTTLRKQEQEKFRPPVDVAGLGGRHISLFIEDNDVSGLDFVLPLQTNKVVVLQEGGDANVAQAMYGLRLLSEPDMLPGANVTVVLTGTGGRCLRGTGPEEELQVPCASDLDCRQIVSSTGGKGGTCLQGTSIHVSPHVVVFTLQDWNVSQSVTVTALDDKFVEPILHHAFVRHDFANMGEGGRHGDPFYNSKTPGLAQGAALFDPATTERLYSEHSHLHADGNMMLRLSRQTGRAPEAVFFKVEVKDDDVAGVEVRRVNDNSTVRSTDGGRAASSGFGFRVGEAAGETDTFEVRLSAIPCRSVFLSISEAQPGGQLRFGEAAKEVLGYLPRYAQIRLSFNRRTWDRWQKVVIFAEDDDQDRSPCLRFTNTTLIGVRDNERADLNDPNFLLRPVRISLSTVIKDDDVAKLLFEWESGTEGLYLQNGSYASGVSIEEGAALAKQPSYRLRLATRPFAPVRVMFEIPVSPVTHVVVDRCPFGPGATNNIPTNITVTTSPLAQLKTTILSSDPSEPSMQSLLFTPENWEKWVVVKIGALADEIFEGPHLGVVSHRLVSTDLNYNGSTTRSATCDENLMVINGSACEQLPLPMIAVDITELNWQAAPLLASAEYDSTGTSVVVKFSGAPTTGVGSVPCETLFDGVVAKMHDPCANRSSVRHTAIKSAQTAFGRGNADSGSCIWITRKSLRVVLGRTATLAGGDILRLKNGVVRSSPTARVFSTDQTVMVSSNQVARPVASIVSKLGSTVSECANVLFDASSSHGGGGRPLNFSWHLKNTTADTSSELYANLTAYLASASFTTAAHLTVPASRFLSPGQSYAFGVGVTSTWYPDYTSEAVIAVTVAAGSVPSVEIMGGNHRELSLSRIPVGGSVDLNARWAVRTCSGSPGSAQFDSPIFFSVEAKDTDTGTPKAALSYACTGTVYDAGSPACQQADTSLHTVVIASRGAFARLPVTKFKKGLRIPKSALTPGLTYTLGVLVFLKTEPWRNNTAYTTLSIARSDLVARISGGVSMSVSASSEFALNATASEDPDDYQASLQFAWSCFHAETADPTVCTRAGSIVDTTSSSSLTIPAGAFVAGTTVSFTVQVSDGSSRASAEATVTRLVVAGTPPVVEIEVASTSSAKDNVDYRTSAGVRIFNEKDAPSFNAVVQSSTGKVVYSWSLVTDENEFGSVEGDISSIWSTPLQGLSRVKLKPSVLRAPASYKFILRASDASGSTGQSSVVIQINSPPSSGVLLCSPASGTSQETLFALEASEWVDTDLPLSYSFFDEGLVQSGSESSHSSTLIRGVEPDSPKYETKLSSGQDRTLRVLVGDNMGASTEARTTVTVTKRVFVSEEAVESAVTNAMSSLSSKMNAGAQSSMLEDPSDMFEAIGLLNENKMNEDLVRTPSDAPGVSVSSAKFAENATKKRVAFRKSILEQTERALEALSSASDGVGGGSGGAAVAASDVLLVMTAVSGATASAGESDVSLRVKGLNITKNVLESVRQGGGKVSSETMSLVIDTCSNTLDGLSAAAGAAAAEDVAMNAAINASAGLNDTSSSEVEAERKRATSARSREVADQVRSTLASLRDAVMTNAVAGEEALAISTVGLSVTIQKVPKRSASAATNSSAMNGTSANSGENFAVPSHTVSLNNNADSFGGSSESASATTSFELPLTALPDDDDIEVLATRFDTNIYDETETAAGTVGLALSQSGVDYEVNGLADAIIIEFPVSPGSKKLAVPKYWNGSGWDDTGLYLLNLTSDTSVPSGKTHLRFSTNHLTDFSATTVVDPSTIVILANDTAVGLIVDNVLGGSSAFAGAASVPAQTIANLWSSSVGNDVDRLAAHSTLFSVVSPAAIPDIVAASVTANPEMANQVAARAVVAAPQLAVEIAVQSLNTTSATTASAKAVVLSVVEMIRNSTSSHWNDKPLAVIFRSVAVANPALRKWHGRGGAGFV